MQRFVLKDLPRTTNPQICLSPSSLESNSKSKKAGEIKENGSKT